MMDYMEGQAHNTVLRDGVVVNAVDECRRLAKIEHAARVMHPRQQSLFLKAILKEVDDERQQT